ncbi:hypothetical protein EVAR_85451_1 [Eumeta japonica]|uniref:Uncharacterized protein n=1 Tax=Eumeta variegata TaxID=151549 RepID=A0A4C1WIJ6_EUMVA|nr:hypothetical protein EVAR_85451_1 [Eumeta japonica]
MGLRSGSEMRAERELPILKSGTEPQVESAVESGMKSRTRQCCARGRPIIVEWERDARHSAGLSLVRSGNIFDVHVGEAAGELIKDKQIYSIPSRVPRARARSQRQTSCKPFDLGSLLDSVLIIPTGLYYGARSNIRRRRVRAVFAQPNELFASCRTDAPSKTNCFNLRGAKTKGRCGLINGGSRRAGVGGGRRGRGGSRPNAVAGFVLEALTKSSGRQKRKRFSARPRPPARIVASYRPKKFGRYLVPCRFVGLGPAAIKSGSSAARGNAAETRTDRVRAERSDRDVRARRPKVIVQLNELRYCARDGRRGGARALQRCRRPAALRRNGLCAFSAAVRRRPSLTPA